ncbi:hydantoinase B/oxoprolinase family protein [Roseomonas sp. AR75]|uniref:hydantoinase B/oxoprolinase family protein n=1 Tax=Roseomonas sp. AR75 TaxID=2562311 RepID=UPI0014855AE5|nr:hydantoinase B/oxoprolinase family protein [Roseomonas sp. AR75]
MTAPAAIDPVKRELIKNALTTIADNMIALVIRTSRSIVVKNNLDFSASVLNARGEMVAQGLSLPGHLGATEPALRGCLDQFGDDIRKGDIVGSNDPYAGGSHLNDIFMFRPVFAGDEIVAYVSIIIHHTDMGGRVPGGNATDSSEIYQEGLRIPPVKFLEADKPNDTLLRLIRNNVRVSDRVLGDIQSQITSLVVAEAEFQRVLKDYGVATVKTYMDDLIDYAEKLTRAGLAALPDGVGEFTDWIDDDGTPDGPPVRLQVKLTKTGDSAVIDFTGTSPQTSGAINPNKHFAIGLAYAVVRTVLDPNIPANAGFNKAITVITPEGSFVNPRFPAPVGARGLAGYRVRHAVSGAMAMLVPDRMAACVGGSEFALVLAGYPKDGKPFLMLEFHNLTGVGGGPHADGQDGGSWCLGNIANVPCEVIEAEGPVRIDCYSFLPDTDGAGKYRGALGLVREYRLLAEDALIQLRSDRSKNPPYGLFGGQPGAPGRIFMNPRTPEERPAKTKFIGRMKQNEVLRGEMPGSGGYGNPRERDAAAVAEDVRQEKISLQRARDVYGVVVDPVSFAVDKAATAALRGG